MPTDKETISKNLAKTSELFQQAIDRMELEQEQYWNSLTKEQQLMAFCAVMRRLIDGDVNKRGTYRFVLYDVFGFDLDSYVAAQCAGYLTIHNLIYTGLECEENHSGIDSD